ncbi:pirin family protein [Paralimibaculum aggregatum]|uniref:Pirin family protein n=1 Tax=Paralimibaculum aggregatum TaxID=3036245 RepID=A0ABQ6LRA6_9RHOB|nr:pirin family protein [Limibaculum sp. NKW23]GMG83819.1 pirin family protein [Limibaculum sp. NKW23]
MRQVLGIYGAPRPHWVGDGFPVRSLLSHATHGQHASPFLLLDYAGAAEFGPSEKRRGVDVHPHRGFETVTIVYQGELEHRDSTGEGGRIGPGDVQWMTAASGILHEEYHSEAFARTGGTLEMVQLWVNLPARHKNAAPGYQTLPAGGIPEIALPDGAGRLRVIAGEHGGTRGPARTFTPINLWDVALTPGGTARLAPPEGHTLTLVVLAGTVLVNDAEVVREAQVVLLGREGGEVTLEANNDARILVLSGEPIDEPVAMQGPFVMNTADEIRQAFAEFRDGRFGTIPARQGTA